MSRTTEQRTHSPLESIRDNIYLKGAALVLAGGALTACASNTAAQENSSAVGADTGSTVVNENTETSTEGTETSTPETGLTIEQVEIPAGLDAQTLGTMLLDRYDDWSNAGTDDSLTEEVRGIGWDALFAKVTEENKAIYANALFVEGWESNPTLSSAVEAQTRTNYGTLQQFALTAWSDDEANKEGYENWLEAVAPIKEFPIDSTSRTLEISYQNNSNSDMNLGPDASIDKGIITVTLTNADGTEKISDININVQ